MRNSCRVEADGNAMQAGAVKNYEKSEANKRQKYHEVKDKRD